MRPIGLLLLVLAPALALAQLPIIGAHHGAVAAGPGSDQQRVTVTGAILDPALPGEPGALHVSLEGDVILSAAPDHAGYTACTGRCQLAAPLRSADLYVLPDSLVTVLGDWPALATAALAATSVTVVRGTLAGPLAVTVTGPVAGLPAVLLTADLIVGPVTAAALPAGTRLVVTLTDLVLDYE